MFVELITTFDRSADEVGHESHDDHANHSGHSGGHHHSANER